MLRWLKTVVVSDVEKAPERCQVGTREDDKPRTAVDVSSRFGVTSKPWPCSGSWEQGLAGAPVSGQAVSGMEVA